MSQAITNNCVLCAQILLYAHTMHPQYVVEYMLIPDGLYNCWVQHNNGSRLHLNADMTIQQAAELLSEFIVNTQLGE